MKTTQKIFVFFLFCCIHGVLLVVGEDGTSSQPTTASSELKFPFVGKIKGRHINVRSGGNINYEILVKLEEGDEVVALQEASDWYEILPPEGCSFWVHQSFIKENQATTDSVNVRVRPSLESTVNCQLNQGEVIDPILQEGEWIKIKPPASARAWVSGTFVVFDRSYEKPPIVDTLPEKSNPVNSVLDTSVSKKEVVPPIVKISKEQAFQLAENFEREEFFKPVDQIQFKLITEKYEKLISDFPEDAELKLRVQKKLEDIQAKQTNITEGSKKGELPKQESSQIGTASSTVSDQSSGIVSEVSTAVKPSVSIRQPKVLSHRVFEGRLEPDGFFKSKNYKLIHDHKRICFISEGTIPLRQYIHQEVKISGPVVASRSRVPVLRAEKIEKQ